MPTAADIAKKEARQLRRPHFLMRGGNANCLVLLCQRTSEKDYGVVDFRDRFDWVYTARVCDGARTQQIIPAMVLDSGGRGTISAVSTANRG